MIGCWKACHDCLTYNRVSFRSDVCETRPVKHNVSAEFMKQSWNCSVARRTCENSTPPCQARVSCCLFLLFTRDRLYLNDLKRGWNRLKQIKNEKKEERNSTRHIRIVAKFLDDWTIAGQLESFPHEFRHGCLHRPPAPVTLVFTPPTGGRVSLIFQPPVVSRRWIYDSLF